MALLTDEELLETFETQLPALLKRHPELEPRVYTAFIETFATKKEVAAVLAELHAFRGEFGQFRSEVNERFEQIDERFEDMNQQIAQINQQIAQINQQIAQMNQQIAHTDAKVDLTVGGFQRRAGRKLENMVAEVLRFGLKRQDVSADNVRLRQKLADVEGVVGPAGRTYEVDILVDNSSLVVFEVKSAACKVEEIDRFADKVALVRRQHPGKAVEGALISLEPADTVKARCAEWGIQIV